MTELMKRYEAEMGKSAIMLVCTPNNSPRLNITKVTDEYVAWLEAQVLDGETIEKFQEIIRNQCDEISALEAQLTWRPVSEKPKIGQKVICMNDYNMVVRTEYQKEGFVIPGYYSDGEPSYTIEWSFGITHWLPIPPMEVK